jgi:3-oxocholest-4-en-26-oyl-CoA dehydrogenase beta subunit
MDFSFSDDQLALSGLARDLLQRTATPERLRDADSGADAFDGDAWKELAKADLLGVALPSDVGGSGGGFIELCLLLEEVGRAVAPVPAFATLLLGALPVDRFGDAALRQRLLPSVIEGDILLSAGLAEPNCSDPAMPHTTARIDGGDWLLTGTKICVPVAEESARVLVPARIDDGNVGLFLVDPVGPGSALRRQVTTTGEPQYELHLTDAPVPADWVLCAGSEAADALAWLIDRALVGLSAIEVGLADAALRMTAAYSSQRVQFGRPLGSFNAVQQRVADAYIDVEGIRWTTWCAAAQLASGRPASKEAMIAKFWAAEAGQRVAAASQHLHGGMGVDVSYPLHRYTRWSKQVELTLGSATHQLVRLGDELAEPVEQDAF